MIGKLKGNIDTIYENQLIIDVGGVGYLVSAGRGLLSKVFIGEYTEIVVETIVREDAITLYGFASEHEKEWFKLLTTVQGVGAKAAIAILSVTSPDKLAIAIASQDKLAITKADGVGPKLAARILGELKDKAASVSAKLSVSAKPSKVDNADAVVSTSSLDTKKIEVSEQAAGDELSEITDEACSALVNLGYQRSEAYQAVCRVISAMHANDEIVDLQNVIKKALKELGLGI